MWPSMFPACSQAWGTGEGDGSPAGHVWAGQGGRRPEVTPGHGHGTVLMQKTQACAEHRLLAQASVTGGSASVLGAGSRVSLCVPPRGSWA